jgi:hypothetical protein
VSLHAQDNDARLEEIELNRFDHKLWEEVVGAKDYNEQEQVKRPKRLTPDSTQVSKAPGNKRRMPVESVEEDDSESSSGGFSFNTSMRLDWIIYGLVVGLIVYVLVLILRNISLKSDKKVTPKALAPADVIVIEDIQELETDRLLREAISSGNYRLAVRMCFLGMLKTLDEDGFIKWKRDKTNRDYLSELFTRQHYYDEIRQLTLNYEVVWYGEHDLTPVAYEDLIGSFKALGSKLNSSKQS